MSITSGKGGTSITGSAVMGYRGLMCLHGLRMYAKYGSSFKLTRGATPAVLRAITTEYTGKTYRRSAQGMANALRDMEALVSVKTLDELGESMAVNALVGGPAADLS
jgi:hypothetical protein